MSFGKTSHPGINFKVFGFGVDIVSINILFISFASIFYNRHCYDKYQVSSIIVFSDRCPGTIVIGIGKMPDFVPVKFETKGPGLLSSVPAARTRRDG